MHGNFSQNKKNTKPKHKLSPSETGEKHATELLLVIKGQGGRAVDREEEGRWRQGAQSLCGRGEAR